MVEEQDILGFYTGTVYWKVVQYVGGIFHTGVRILAESAWSGLGGLERGLTMRIFFCISPEFTIGLSSIYSWLDRQSPVENSTQFCLGKRLMAFHEALHNMNDPGLRHRLLNSLMEAHLPDEKQLPKSPAQLSAAVLSIRRHHLLSELLPSGTLCYPKAGDVRKGAIEAWIEHLLGLLCSTVAENRWAGVCLLGLTCQECSRQRFLESYSSWFQKLLLPLKQTTDPVFIRAAACASLTDLLTRLGGLIDYAGVRRDGAVLIAKLVQPVLQILGDKDSNSIWSEAIDLLSAVLRCFPSCLRQHSNNVEAILVARLMDADCASLTQKCSLCLALLPKAHGDASTWSSMIRRILIAINTELELAFTGMEDAASAEDVLSTLLPRGQDPPWPLGGPSVATHASAQTAKGFWQQLVPRVSSLLQCCQFLLTNPYPVPVPVPTGPLLALAMRILQVDGSRLAIPSSLGSAVSSVHQASLCSELPALHLNALELLTATLFGVRSQLLPHAGDIARLVTDYFRRWGAVPSFIRVKLYDFARHLFVALGAGMASALAPAVVASALSDLKGTTGGTSVLSPKTARTPRMSSSGAWSGQLSNHRKRKEPGSLPSDQQSNGNAEVSINAVEGCATTAVQIAALRALEALLTSGGALLPDRWRAEVDAVIACVAVGALTGTSCSGLNLDEESIFLEGNTTSSSSAFQVAAYRALLASLLSPCCHRPPYLAQGLAVFRKGRQEAGSEVAEVCAHALLALEPLIHPRCLPPAGTPAAMAAGMATGRATSAGALVSNLLRAGKPPLTTTGAVSVGNGGPGVLNFANSVIPSALKVNQLAMDPWAEVDTWLGYGEDFGEDENLFYDDDGILVDDFDDALEGNAAPSAGVSFYENKVMQQSNYREERDQIGEKGAEDSIGPPEETMVQVFPEPNENGRGCVLVSSALEHRANSHLEQTDIKPSTVGSEKCSSVLVGQNDCSLLSSKEIPLTSEPNVIMEIAGPLSDSEGRCEVPCTAGDMMSIEQTEANADMDENVSTTLVGSSMFCVLGPKTPSMAAFSFPNSSVEIGSESDSDGVLPDIIDGDPDSS